MTSRKAARTAIPNSKALAATKKICRRYQTRLPYCFWDDDVRDWQYFDKKAKQHSCRICLVTKQARRLSRKRRSGTGCSPRNRGRPQARSRRRHGTFGCEATRTTLKNGCRMPLTNSGRTRISGPRSSPPPSWGSSFSATPITSSPKLKPS